MFWLNHVEPQLVDSHHPRSWALAAPRSAARSEGPVPEWPRATRTARQRAAMGKNGCEIWQNFCCLNFKPFGKPRAKTDGRNDECSFKILSGRRLLFKKHYEPRELWLFDFSLETAFVQMRVLFVGVCTATFAKSEICRNEWCANIAPPQNEDVSVLLQWFLSNNKNRWCRQKLPWSKHPGIKSSMVEEYQGDEDELNMCVTKRFQIVLSWKMDPITIVLWFIDIYCELDCCQSLCIDSWALVVSWV